MLQQAGAGCAGRLLPTVRVARRPLEGDVSAQVPAVLLPVVPLPAVERPAMLLPVRRAPTRTARTAQRRVA
jgi:hypothetical protein